MEATQKNLLPLTGFLDRVLIFDDDRDDASAISKVLSSNEIACEIYTPDELNGVTFHKNRQVIFCDLHMWGNLINKPEDIAAKIRELLENTIAEDFGAYGMVVWTQHEEEVDILTSRLSKDRQSKKYNTPIFVVSLSKLIFKEKGYSGFIAELVEKLQNSISASFYVSWGNIAKGGFNNAITSLYSRINDFSKQDEVMLPLLSAMALNYTGLPDDEIPNYRHFSEDTFHAMNDMLCTDLYGTRKTVYELYRNAFIKPLFNNMQEEISLYSFLNASLFLNVRDIDQNQIVPGNVYEIKSDSDYIISDKPKTSKPILVELTPPCDYSHKKVKSRLVAGYLYDCPVENNGIYKILGHKFQCEYSYIIWPIEINNTPSIIYFDFRYLFNIKEDELKDQSKYQLLFRLSHGLFADVLQKFSSHAARLGENVLKPKLIKPKEEGDEFLKDERILIARLKKHLVNGSIDSKESGEIFKTRRFKLSNSDDREYLKPILKRYGITLEEDGHVTIDTEFDGANDGSV